MPPLIFRNALIKNQAMPYPIIQNPLDSYSKNTVSNLKLQTRNR